MELGYSGLLPIVAGYGAPGLIVAWFCWRDWRRDVRDEKRREKEEELERERIKADLALATGYAVLAERIERLTHVRGD